MRKENFQKIKRLSSPELGWFKDVVGKRRRFKIKVKRIEISSLKGQQAFCYFNPVHPAEKENICFLLTLSSLFFFILLGLF